MPGILDGRHVVITGGTGALGRALTEVLLDAGAHCHIPGYGASVPEDFELADHERVSLLCGVDLTREAAVVDYYAQVSAQASAEAGAIWASVHIAGGFAMAPVLETSLDDMHKMIEMNGITCFLTCREAIRAMRSCTPKGGRIVNVASRPALEATGGMIAYTASKAMVASMTQSLAQEVKADGILVNAVVPSIIDTPANRAAMPDADHASWPKPAQIASAIQFLVSPGNALTSGMLCPVYGAH